MSGLWELTKYERNATVLTPGDTIPAMFLNAVKARGDRVWMREKKLGIWREWS